VSRKKGDETVFGAAVLEKSVVVVGQDSKEVALVCAVCRYHLVVGAF